MNDILISVTAVILMLALIVITHTVLRVVLLVSEAAIDWLALTMARLISYMKD